MNELENAVLTQATKAVVAAGEYVASIRSTLSGVAIVASVDTQEPLAGPAGVRLRLSASNRGTRSYLFTVLEIAQAGAGLPGHVATVADHLADQLLGEDATLDIELKRLLLSDGDNSKEVAANLLTPEPGPGPEPASTPEHVGQHPFHEGCRPCMDARRDARRDQEAAIRAALEEEPAEPAISVAEEHEAAHRSGRVDSRVCDGLGCPMAKVADRG
jgi:hypothetical protein